MKPAFVFLLVLIAATVEAKVPESCLEGETPLFHCVNNKAGWGYDKLVVDGCKNSRTGEYALIVKRVDPNKYYERVVAERNDEDLQIFGLEAFVYQDEHHFQYSFKTGKGSYSISDIGAVSLECKLLVSRPKL